MVRTTFTLFLPEAVKKLHVESSPRSDRRGDQGKAGDQGKKFWVGVGQL